MKVTNKNGKHFMEVDDYEMLMIGAILDERLGGAGLDDDETTCITGLVEVIKDVPLLDIKPLNYQIKF